MEIPENIKTKYGSVGETIYKTAHKAGVSVGSKVQSEPFATEMNSLVNGILNAKKKAGSEYKAPNSESLKKLIGQKYGIGKPDPDRNGLKQLATMIMKVIEGMPKPEPKKAIKPEKVPA